MSKPSQEDFRWGPLLAELERNLAGRGLRAHLAALAAFRSGYERQVRKLGGMARPPWTTEMIVELAAVFRLAPFEDYYVLAPRDGRCPHCRAPLAGRDAWVVRAVLSERAIHACRTCGGRWLVIGTQSR
ncbi:MAG TPA: hypothetical protein VFX59_28655 [Polyangiales bacterium]|nr:hypothetical protein [Polyangiales bacterium]